MKSGWANGLRGIVALVLLTGASRTHAQTARDSSAAEVAKEEPKITTVRIVKEDGQVLTASPAGIAIQAGKTLERGKIAESLRILYKTGDYADVRAVVTPATDGVRLDFVVRENLFFNQVRIEGLTAPPSDASAAAAMQLTLGQTYRKLAVDEALERLRETLREEGLYRAEVSAGTVPHAETHQVDVVVHVKPGPRARVGIIQLKNAGANVFLNLSSPKFAAQGIRKAYDLEWRPVHYLTSPSASVQSVMKPAGFDAGQGIMTIAYLKDPTDPQWANDPEFLEWKRWMEKWNPTASLADTLNELGAKTIAMYQTTSRKTHKLWL